MAGKLMASPAIIELMKDQATEINRLRVVNKELVNALKAIQALLPDEHLRVKVAALIERADKP